MRAVLVAVVIAVLLWLMVDRTRIGAMIRAGVDDPEIARVVGINVSQLFTLIFCLGAALAGFAGVIGAPYLSIYPGLDAQMLPLALIVVILGAISYQNMVVDIFPEINLPVVAVATFYKGMGPSEIEGAITLRLEQLFLQASYVEHIESRSLPGVSLIKVYFHPSYNVNDGLSEITSLTYSSLRYLPQGVFPPIIIKFGASSLPIANVTVSSDSLGEKEVRDVQNIADILVDPEGARDRRDHWEKTAHALLTGAILHVLYAEADKTLHRVATFLADPARSIERTLRIMLTTNHLGADAAPMVHPVVASVARELLNKSENERSGVVSTAMSLLGLYRDPIVAGTTARSDWRIADLMDPARPVSLYLVVPPSDISRTRPLVRLILNQIARRLTEKLEASAGAKPPARQLLLMLDEFPALGRLEFFETALTFLAGYGVRAFLVAQSLNQIEKAYGPNNAILDNCHVRVAFAPNDERTAKRLSEALGTMTEQRAQRK